MVVFTPLRELCRLGRRSRTRLRRAAHGLDGEPEALGGVDEDLYQVGHIAGDGGDYGGATSMTGTMPSGVVPDALFGRGRGLLRWLAELLRACIMALTDASHAQTV